MNLKEYYFKLLSESNELITLIGQGHIISAYPQEIKTFPLVIFEDMNSADIEFADNLPNGTSAQVRVHVFSKTIDGFPKAEIIADVVRSIFRADYWSMQNNTEISDVSDSIKHRVMDFRREFYSL